jgi:hypothetical protein
MSFAVEWPIFARLLRHPFALSDLSPRSSMSTSDDGVRHDSCFERGNGGLGS